jgi:succinate dehydrogenase / fumarate reductase membrane anchor subunit
MSAYPKEYRNPLKKARGLGSAQHGVSHWWVQRVTAIALVGLGIWLVALVLRMLHADNATARELVARPWNAVLLIAFVVTAFWHAVLGLQVVIEDYVHVPWQEWSLQIAVKFACALAALAAIVAVGRIAFTA